MTTSRSGFTIVEVVVAIIVLSVGILGLGGTTAFMVRQVTLSDLLTERAAAFQTIVDRLQSLPYDEVLSGTDSVGIFEVSWSSTDDGPQNKVVIIETLGPGLGGTTVPSAVPQVADTFEFRILRR